MQNYNNSESILSGKAPCNTDEADKKLTFDQALEQVGSSHFYQKRAFVYFGFQWLFASWILFAPVYIFAAPDVICNGNKECLETCKDINSFNEKECNEFLCRLDTQERLALLTKNSLITAFDDPLICENESLGTTLKAMVSLGSLIGFFVFSLIADNYGRKLGLGSSWLCASIGAVVLASSQNFTMVGIGLFLLGFGINPSITIQYSLINEHTLGKFRDIQNIGVQIFYGIGETLIVFIAYYFKDWRMMAMYWFCIPLIIMNFGIKYIYESPKFVYSKNKQKSIKILNQIAKVNNREPIQDNQLESSKSEQNDKRVYTVLDLLKYRSINVLFVCAFLTFCTIQCVYYGINFAMESIGLGLYKNALIIGIFETLAFVIADNLIFKLKRKKTIIIGLIISGVLLLLFLLLNIPSDCGNICTMKIIQIGFAGLIRFVVCFVMATMYTYMSELFPTVVRSLAVGLISAGGTIGSAAAPFILQISNNIGIASPLIPFGIISLLGCLAVIPLHETWDQLLPDDIAEDLKKPQQVQDVDQDVNNCGKNIGDSQITYFKENQTSEIFSDQLFDEDEPKLNKKKSSIQNLIANEY